MKHDEFLTTVVNSMEKYIYPEGQDAVHEDDKNGLQIDFDYLKFLININNQ